MKNANKYPKEWTALTKVFPKYSDRDEKQLNKDLESGIVVLMTKGRATYLKAA